MKHNILLFLTAIFFYMPLTLKGQNSVLADSLASKSFQELEDLFYESKPDTLKATLYANSYYLKALKEKDTMKMVEGKYFLADIKDNDEIYLNFCDSLIEICKKKPTKQFPAAIHLDKSRFFFHSNDQFNSLQEIVKVKNYLEVMENDLLYSLYYLRLGLLKNHSKNYEQALYFYKKAHQYSLKTNNTYENKILLSIPLNISLIYYKLKKYDSAIIANKKAANLFLSINDTISLGYTFYNAGSVYFDKLEISKAIESYKKSIPYIKSDENYRVLCIIYSKLGRSFEILRKRQRALKYHLCSDSIYNLRKIRNSYLKYSFSFLANYYEEQQDSEKQLHYVNKLLELREFELTEKNKIQQTFTNEFDIPNLLAERKRIVEEIEARSRRNQFVFISLLGISIGFIFYQVRKNRIQRKRFQTLLNKQEKDNESSINTQVQNSRSKLELSESIVTSILKQLEKFEDNNEFIDVNLNLQNLASKFDTNASYLSKMVNHYKQTSFSNYINQLRIEYCIEQLKNNELWRKYTIKAIANEVGFNKAESFSKAFYKYTELKPSYFIKELKKTQTNNISNEA
ncbi:helix-turn-helix domain-containing protein [Tenacibaculum xiamenense]|uniref:helix-turn-helix domain-containing protein n=1 Tax=Tenacibaculum xiamenense TaxID=1261553 RepID=UPI003895F4E6